MTVEDESDRGAATALAAVLSLALLGVLWFGVALGSALIHRHRAEGAADLAALAAATYGPHGSDTACRAAEWVADGMDVVVTRCHLHDGNAWVEVRAAAPEILPVLPRADARARAGPLEVRSSP